MSPPSITFGWPHRIGAGRGWPSPLLLSNLVFGTDSPSLVCCQRRSVLPRSARKRDTAATAAGCGRTDTLSMKGSLDHVSRRNNAGDRDAALFFQAAAAKYRFCLCFSRPGQRSRNIVLVATVDHTESHARNSLPELRASIAQPPGSQWALFNRKGQEPDSRFAHF
jgi:hypothetical protein